MKKRCIVLFSGGLDSRLAVKIMQKKGFKVLAIYFKLPFGCSCFGDVKEFLNEHKVKLKIFDCTKGKLLQEYLEVVNKGKHGRGAGFNPCIDCKIFMFKKAKEFAKKRMVKFIATGEVVGQRPMSQQDKQIKLIEKRAGLEGKIIRPLVDLEISGRQRKKQIELAKQFDIDYPDPAGGCLLCEKLLKKRFEVLLKRGLNKEEVSLVNVGRHFFINDCWIILGKDKKQNDILENYKIGEKMIPNYPGPTALLLDKCNSEIRDKIIKLIHAYSKGGSLKERKKFEKFKL